MGVLITQLYNYLTVSDYSTCSMLALDDHSVPRDKCANFLFINLWTFPIYNNNTLHDLKNLLSVSSI